MRFGSGGPQEKDSDSIHGQSSNRSFRRSKYVVSPDRSSCISITSKNMCHSKKVAKALKYYARTLVDLELFTNSIGDWVLEKSSSHSNRIQLFGSPFVVDELRKFDYALEGVLFQQLFRMPNSHYNSDDTKECQYLALEDFIHTAVDGLWRTFWQKTGLLPFSVSCPCHPWSKFHSIEKAILNNRLGGLSGAAVVVKNEMGDSQVQWNQVLEFALFRPGITHRSDIGLSASTICEAVLYGFHILLSRGLSKCTMKNSDSVYILVLDSKLGGVIKFRGDLSKLDINSSNPYNSVGEWIKLHTEILVSPIYRIWNKLGNPNWGDLGTLQLLLATFNSIAECKGPPINSIESLASDHSLRLQKRRIECNGLLPMCHGGSDNHGEIVELGCDVDHLYRNKKSCLEFKPGEVVMLENPECGKGFQIKEILPDGNCYGAISLNCPSKLLTLYAGAHSSRLEPSWEAMSLWYLVQRQTKVLNIMKQQGISSKHLPEIVAFGRILHPGPCKKHGPGDRCDHPLCGTPILVTSPVGKSLSCIIAQDGPFSSEDALRCCRDSLIALRTAAEANIQHGDICPENIVCVDAYGAGLEPLFYVPVSWGHAVLEDRDSPAMNLQFSSIHALQYRKLCPSSDVESLIYLLYFVCGGTMQHMDSIESALKWKERCWAKRLIQQQLGEVSTLLKAFADYVDSLCGTPYTVDFEFWLSRLNKEVNSLDKGKLVERVEVSLKLEDMAESSGTAPILY